MDKTTAILALSTVLLMSASPAFAGPEIECETRLEQGSTFENMVDQAVEFETSLLGLEGFCRGNRCLREAQSLRAEFNGYIEDLLNRAATTAELFARYNEMAMRATFLRAKVESTAKPAVVAAPAVPRTILNFLEDPSQLLDGMPVTVGNEHSYVRSVTFADGILFQFWELALHLQAKFLRSIFAGVVGPVGEAGIKPLSSISRHLVEVKIFGGGARLIGCLKGGSLTVLRLELEHVHSKGTLTKYGSLCD